MPGRSYSREFLLAWSDLLMQASSRGHQVMISQQYSSVVHFARAKCMGGDVLKGPDQKPFQGSVDYDVMMWIDSDIVFKPDDFFALLGEYETSIKRGPGLGDELPTARRPPNSFNCAPFKTFTFNLLAEANFCAWSAIHAGVLILEGVWTRSRARATAFARI